MTLSPRRQRLQLVRSDDDGPAQPSVVMAISDRKLAKAVSRVLRAANMNLHVCSDLDAVVRRLDGGRADLLIHELTGELPDASELDARLAHIAGREDSPPLVLLNAHLIDATHADIFERVYGRNLIAKVSGPSAVDAGELLITIRKLLDRDVFGAEKYVRWGSVLHSLSVHRTSQKDGALSSLASFLEDLEADPRVVSALQTVADELIMNALYNAPVVDGERIHAARPRSEEIVLDPAQAAVFEFCSDGRLIAVSCRDPFGSLSASRAQECLARATRGGADQITWSGGGAGIGLYMIYRAVDQLVVNIDPGRATEFVAVVDLTHSFRERAGRPKSVNIFSLRG